MAFTAALLPASKLMPVWDDDPKVAVPVGTPAGVQFAAVFQSPLAG